MPSGAGLAPMKPSRASIVLLLATVGCRSVHTETLSGEFRYEDVKRTAILAADYDEEKIDVKLELTASFPRFSAASEFRELNLHIRDEIEGAEAYFGTPISSPRAEASETSWAEVDVDCEIGLFTKDLVSVRCTRTLLGNTIPHQLGGDTVFTFKKEASGKLSPVHFEDLFPVDDARNALVKLIMAEWCATDASVVPGDRICDFDLPTQESWASECVEPVFLGKQGVEFSNYRYPDGFEATIPYCTVAQLLSSEFRQTLCPAVR